MRKFKIGERVQYTAAIDDGPNYRDWIVVRHIGPSNTLFRRVSDSVEVAKDPAEFQHEPAVIRLSRLS